MFVAAVDSVRLFNQHSRIEAVAYLGLVLTPTFPPLEQKGLVSGGSQR